MILDKLFVADVAVVSGSSQAPFPVASVAWQLHKVAALTTALLGYMWSKSVTLYVCLETESCGSDTGSGDVSGAG